MTPEPDVHGRIDQLARLALMPLELADTLGWLDERQACERVDEAGFAPVEHAWHLADLECEGFGSRIGRLLKEEQPLLADFDGAALAAERNYRSRSLAAGLAAFAAARAANLALLARVAPGQWSRSGLQAGVGPVSLADMPALMLRHDDAHRAEIAAWLAARMLTRPAGREQ
jgi:hypothetical protein